MFRQHSQGVRFAWKLTITEDGRAIEGAKYKRFTL